MVIAANEKVNNGHYWKCRIEKGFKDICPSELELKNENDKKHEV